VDILREKKRPCVCLCLCLIRARIVASCCYFAMQQHTSSHNTLWAEASFFQFQLEAIYLFSHIYYVYTNERLHQLMFLLYLAQQLINVHWNFIYYVLSSFSFWDGDDDDARKVLALTLFLLEHTKN
jgi:hypothetical protein